MQRTAKSHAKVMETGKGKELGFLMQQMDHERIGTGALWQKDLSLGSIFCVSSYIEGDGWQGLTLWYS